MIRLGDRRNDGCPDESVSCFEGWQATTAGVKEIKKQLRTILWMRYKLKDQDLFDKAYAYVEMYY